MGPIYVAFSEYTNFKAFPKLLLYLLKTVNIITKVITRQEGLKKFLAAPKKVSFSQLPPGQEGRF